MFACIAVFNKVEKSDHIENLYVHNTNDQSVLKVFLYFPFVELHI